MSEVVTYSREGNIGVITVDYPPVNALSHAVLSGLIAAREQGQKDSDAKALLLGGGGGTFLAGANIGDFVKPIQERGWLPWVEQLENADRRRFAAINGPALGGG